MDESLNVTETTVTEETAETTAEVEEVTAETTDSTTATTDEEGAEVTAEETDNAGTEPEETPAAPFLTVNYNKQHKDLTREEAQFLAKKGMKWDAFMDTYNELTMLAEESGHDSAAKFVRALMQSRENVELQRLINELGEGKEALAKEILETRRAERKSKFKGVEEREREAAEAEQATREQTLAAQFTELQEEFPEYTSLDKVPKAVRTLAERKDISLLDAALRYQRSENRRIQAEEKKQQEAAKASTGSLKSEPENNKKQENAVFAAFDRAFGR